MEFVEWRRFAEGERVRVHLSPECQRDHEDAENGRAGTVSAILGPDNWAEMDEVDLHDYTHLYIVDYDHPFAETRPLIHLWFEDVEYGIYTANELELIEPLD